ncbi:ThiF family adenylyltransferase [Pontibacter sp. G13]|uniref:ThiF family adenylyltransferase n=1 Tax=Pontibacter sp. G13 TaxID=3074898 RepID=UPI002889B7BE|nr:ThiF family adenylyltransferase [Pontibacter sp. G13]WNJ18348.1 ThiF family adenylyltransferase [Pontibacter sp. G13]
MIPFHQRLEFLHPLQDKTRVSELMADPQTEVFDTISKQIEEWEAIRRYSPLSEKSFDPNGIWVYYPWSRRLVRILNEEQFVEVRTNRNRNKLTYQEQQILSQKRVGIIGLSVGKATAITLAMERAFGEIRLADFDTLELSNLNRIHAGIHHLGIPKWELVAREILEIDPFLKVIGYPDGIHPDNLSGFLTTGGKLDVLVDECDSLDIKILCRLAARDLLIPVLMETSDRGMLDVERFDLTPDRPILHGLIDHLDIAELRHLKTSEEKAPFVQAILGADQISDRLRESMADIGTHLLTWPQLASAVALGGAVITDTWRRMVLGEYRSSGRFYVDLSQLVSHSNFPV